MCCFVSYWYLLAGPRASFETPGIVIIQCCSVVVVLVVTLLLVVVAVVSFRLFSLIELKYRFSTPAAPERQRTPEDSASEPHPTHTAALAIPGERTGVAPELGER